MKRHRRTSLLVGLTVLTIIFTLESGWASESGEPAAALTPDSVQGRYEGYLPCADCPGIEYKLWLSADGTFSESVFYTGRSLQPAVRKGTYTVEGDILVLDKSEAGLEYFAPHPHGLQVLDIHGRQITGNLSRRYILTRKTESDDVMLTNETLMLMRKKLDQGIDFYAFGNEPSWSLDIDFEKGMWFKSLTDLPEMNTPPGREDRAQDADVTRYFAQTEVGTLIVTVLRGECRDAMSGERFPFKSRVEVKRSVDADYTGFEGCGRYVMDSRLNDIWVLTLFGDRKLEAQDFRKGLPVLEFHLNENRVVGSTGCNQISGKFETRGNRITIGQLDTTRMACPNMAFEEEFLSAVTGETFHYAIDAGRLMLTGDNGVVLELRKTD
ncbi:MAG: META domain-containing protein [Desulfobacterales bacterium]